MLVIGKKKYRNMQEQVAYNSEEIERINKYLDGIDLEDKLIIIDSTSGELSDEEMLIAQSPLAFISNGSTVYIKVSEDQNEIMFRACDIVATEVGSAYFNVGGSKIVVTRTTKEFALSSDAFITTYSKSQIDSILSGYALLSGATFTGDVQAKTLNQTEANYSFPLTNLNVTTAEKEFTNIYNVCKVVNNQLIIVLLVKTKNLTESAIDMRDAFNGTILLPDKIAEKIIDYSGRSVKEAAISSNVRIAIENGFATKTLNDPSSSDTPEIDWKLQLYNSSVANRLNIRLDHVSSYTMPALGERYITGRIILNLID